MYRLFVSENPGMVVASISLYVQVIRELNLGFFRPEKDQCSLCMTYKKGDASTKENVQELFDKHTQENIKVRSLKDIL